jgi:hypothetical protein
MAGRYDIVIEQGASFRREINWQPGGVMADLTGYTARMHVRADYADVSPQVTLTTENGRIAVSDDSGDYNILLTMTPSTTAALDDWGRGVWDLEIVSGGGTVTRVLEGYALLSLEATQ